MKYEKPELLVSTAAVSAIQGVSGKGSGAIDTYPNLTTPAYEADE
jgi:hypothetical protein